MKLLHRFAVTIFYTLLLVGCDQNDESHSGIQIHLDSGRSYLEQGQFNAAIIEARSALQKAPDNESATVLLAQIYLELSMSNQAMRLLEGIDGESFDYYHALARSYIDRGKYGSTLLLLRQNSEVFAPHELARLLLSAQARIGLQDVVAAAEDYERALQLAPDNVDVRLGLIRVQALTGDLETAEERIKQVLIDNPNSVDALRMLGVVYIRQGRMDLAEATLTEAISALPVADIFTRQRASLLQTLIRLLAFQGRSGEALIYQKMLSEAFPNSQIIGDKMSQLMEILEAGRFDDALAILDEIDAIAPENETTGTLRGVIAFLQEDDSLAEDFFLKNVDLEIASSRALQMFASNQFRLSQPHKVLQILKERAQHSNDPDTLALFGVAAMSADQKEEGEAAMRKAILLAPERVRLSVILAQHLSVDDPDAALAVLESAYKRNPVDLFVRLSLLSLYMDLGKSDQAREFVSKLLEQDGQNYSTHQVSGSYYAQVGNYSEAEAAFNKAIELKPEQLNSYLGLAKVQLQDNRSDEAEQTYLRIIERNAQSVAAYIGLLNTYVRRGQKARGIQLLSDLAQSKQTNAPLAVISNFLASAGDTVEAEQYMSQAKNNSKTDTYWRQVNASIYLKKARRELLDKEYDSARSDVFTALASFPANKTLLGLLVSIEIESESLGEAKKVLDQMEEIHPGSRLLAIRMGDYAVATGDLEKAREHYATAWEMRVSDRLGQDYYTVLMALGRLEEAKSLLGEWRTQIPQSAVALVNYVEMMTRDGESQTAIDIYQDYLEEFPNSQIVLNNLAWMLLETGLLDEAISVSKRAYNEAPNSGLIADTYGWALYKANRFSEAVDVLERAVSLAPDVEIQDHLDQARQSLAE